MDKKREVLDKILCYAPLADGVAETFHPFCEVVLHDLSDLSQSLVYIAGNLTNRELGGTATDLVLKQLKKYGDDVEDIIGYEGTSVDGKIYKSSTIFIRDKGKVIGCYCINLETTYFQLAINMLEKLCAFKDESPKEHFTTSIKKTFETITEEAIAAVGKPLSVMSKEDKMAIVGELEERGLFMVKGSVDDVASELNVSKFTIYNYLDEYRAKQSKKNIIK